MNTKRGGLWLVALAAACTESSPVETSVSLAVGNEPRAERLDGAREVSFEVKGKKFRIQRRFEEGSQSAQMIYQDGIPLVKSELETENRKVVYVRNTWYDSSGTPIALSIHEFKEPSILGRCIEWLLPQKAMAQYMDCSSQAQELALATMTAASAAYAMRVACTGVPATAPACVAATVVFVTASSAVTIATRKYDECMAATNTGGAAGGGGGGGWTGPTTKTTTTGTGTTGGMGSCYQLITSVYSLATGELLSQSSEWVCK